MNINKRTKIPVTLKNALAFYYANRACGTHQIWDKDSDIRNIDEVCQRLKMNFQACAGTFWFKRKKDKSSLRVDETSFPFATRSK